MPKLFDARGGLWRVARLSAIAFLICISSGAAADAQCPPWRPCGAGNSWGGNRLVAQEFRGVDFRPACAAHDACLATCASRADCDRQFLCDLQAACAYSCNPAACNRKARQFYAGARLAHLFQR